MGLPPKETRHWYDAVNGDAEQATRFQFSLLRCLQRCRPEDLSAFASAHPDYNYASILKAFAKAAQLSTLYAYGDFTNAHKLAGASHHAITLKVSGDRVVLACVLGVRQAIAIPGVECAVYELLAPCSLRLHVLTEEWTFSDVRLSVHLHIELSLNSFLLINK